MSSRSIDREIIETYFESIDGHSVCKLCRHKLKGDRAFNLKTHIIKVHKKKEVALMISEAKTQRAKKIQKQIIKIEINKKQVLRSYIGLVTEDSIPFKILNSENFKNIVDPICRGLSADNEKKLVLTSKNCKNVLQLVSDKIRNEIKADVNRRLFSLKINSATLFSTNMFGISVQLIKGGKIKSRLLGMFESENVGVRSPRNLVTEVLNILARYDANLSQIVSITTDNCANIGSCAPKLLSQGIFDFEERYFDDGNETYLRNIKTFEDGLQIYVGDTQLRPCSALIGQLCVLDVSKNPDITSFLFCCRNLVKFIRKSSGAFRESLQIICITLPELDCPKRWGSTYTMIKSIKCAKDVLLKIEPVQNKSIDENFELGDSFWNFVEAYCIVFDPLQQAILKFQEEDMHYGNFYAEWLKCKLCTEKIPEKAANPFIKKISKILLSSMENRTKELLSNENLVSCLYLDPRFNHTLTPTQKFEASTHLKKLHEKSKAVNEDIIQIKTEITLPACSEGTQFSQKADEYLNEYLSQSFLAADSEDAEVSAKIENLQLQFLRVDSNVLQFWRDKQYIDPELYALSNICFAVPATHVSLERDFSSLRLIMTDSSNYIDRENLENILLIKMNPTYLDEAIESLPLFEEDE